MEILLLILGGVIFTAFSAALVGGKEYNQTEGACCTRSPSTSAMANFLNISAWVHRASELFERSFRVVCLTATAPVLSGFCNPPPGKYWHLNRAVIYEAIINGKQFSCAWSAGGTRADHATEGGAGTWKCGAVRIVVIEPPRIYPDRTSVDYELIDKEGEIFRLWNYFTPETEPRLVCQVSPDGQTATGTRTETASNQAVHITLVSRYSFDLRQIKERRPSL